MVEIVMVLLIMSILAVIALPSLQKQALRSKEYQLRRDLIEVRSSIDKFHKDWTLNVISSTSVGVSNDGFPTSWAALVEGVQDANTGLNRRYLRSIPINPFATDETDPWLLLGYTDAKDSKQWNGIDIFDIHAKTSRVALDGTKINEW